MTTEYNLKRTIGQTMKSNPYLEKISPENSGKYSKRFLFDFSLLNNANIQPEPLQEIKAQIMKYCNSVTSRELAIFRPRDIYTVFEWYSGYAYIKPHMCYDEHGKQVYVIMELVKIDLVFSEKKTIYDQLEVVREIHEFSATNNAIEELNIA